jgi:dethiobiotin synthetase
MKGICVAGIDTEVGKSVVSMLLAKAFDFSYWKPVQSGGLDMSDTLFVNKHAPEVHCIPERFRFSKPVSPHEAAQHDKVSVQLSDFELPTSNKPVLVESAGGVMSPVSLDFTNLQLFEKLNLPVVLVVKNYLGSINHTLLSLSVLKSKLNVVGIIVSGDCNSASEEAYERLGGVPILHHVPVLNFTAQSVEQAAADLKKSLSSTFAEL